MTSIISIKEIRRELWKTERLLRTFKCRNRLEQKYLSKMQYMLMHLRMYPCKKNVMNNWVMPDYSDISKLEMKTIKEKGNRRAGE